MQFGVSDIIAILTVVTGFYVSMKHNNLEAQSQAMEAASKSIELREKDIQLLEKRIDRLERYIEYLLMWIGSNSRSKKRPLSLDEFDD